MAIEEMDAMNLMPLETPVLKVSRPVAVGVFVDILTTDLGH